MSIQPTVIVWRQVMTSDNKNALEALDILWALIKNIHMLRTTSTL